MSSLFWGRIDAPTAPYGSWLQAEVKQDTRKALRGHHFGLGEEDATMDFDDDNRPSDLAALVVSPVVNDSLPIGSNLGVPGNPSDDHGQNLDSQHTITEDPYMNGNFSRVDLSPNIPNLNLDINAAELEELDPISPIIGAHFHEVVPGFIDAGGMSSI